MNPKLWWGVRHIRYAIHLEIFWRKWKHYYEYTETRGVSDFTPTEYITDLSRIMDMREKALKDGFISR